MTSLTSILTCASRFTAGLRLRILTDALVGCVRVGCGLLFIWLSKRLIDIAVGDAAGTLPPYAVLLALTVVVETACAALQGHLETSTEALLKNRLRHQLFDRVMNSRWDGKERFHTGDVVNRLEEDVRLTAETLCRTLPGTLATLIQAAGAFLFLCSLNILLAGVVAGILPIFLLAGKFYTRRMRRLTADIRTADIRVQSLLQENLQHRTLIMGLQRIAFVSSLLASVQDTLYHKVMHRNRFTQFTRVMMLTGFGAGYFVAFLWGVVQLQQGAVTFGMLTAFLQLVGQVQRPTADLSRQLPSFVHAAASVERLAQLSQLPPEESAPASEETSLTGIRMEHVTFAYPDGRHPILHAFSHNFRPGSSTAIVGETGAGKSTLLRLLLALLRPQSGSIHLYNNEGRSRQATAATRRSLVYVPQGNSLLSGTIRTNLLLGRPHATDYEIREALHTAAADFAEAMPQGLDTPCGEQGTGLSEGQAQRIAIARALLCPGGILLLDEFSSALDADTEHLLMDRLTAHAAGKTLIFITHRHEIADRCDEIIKLSK
ncbi:MAG: ABC transporter ATP-binding protein [Bacteroides sp.]